jgi:hypothetical protein
MNHTHAELIEIGYKWCLTKCGFAFKDLVTIAGEVPDVIGFNSEGSFLLEAKTTKADFNNDTNKWFRKNPDMGMGDWRFYICNKGLIKIEELPEMWGLIEVNEKGKVRISHNPFGKGNIYSHWKKNEKSIENEKRLLYSALRRIQEKGMMHIIYPEK